MLRRHLLLYGAQFSTIYLFLILLPSGICLLDPVSIGIGASIIGGYWFGDVLKDQTYCRLTECCNERYIPADIEKLKRNLNQNVFGQHIVLTHLIPALEAHFSEKTQSRKPLVISFHGTPGTGKNFVADEIASALYENGMKSRFVHKYLGRADFPLAKESNTYNAKIQKEVREAIAECPYSLFIFDEVDKMPSGVFESLSSLLGYNSVVNGRDYTKAVFIFLSNTAGVHISDQLGKLLNDGKLREETRLADFEKILQKAAFNLEGGMKETSLIDTHVIDHFFPFLPMEKEHVRKCIVAEFHRWKIEPQEHVIEDIFNNVITYDRQYGLFAISGCKTLEKKIAVAARLLNS